MDNNYLNANSLIEGSTGKSVFLHVTREAPKQIENKKSMRKFES
jgi:hypothetical protein